MARTFGIALIATALLAVSTPVSALWPLPRDLKTGSTAIQLASDFDIKLTLNNVPTDLREAVTRTKGYLKNDKLERLVVGRGASDSAIIKAGKKLKTLTVSLYTQGETVKSISEEAIAAIEERDDAYELDVPGDGSDAVLKANSTLGLFRGLTTFSQLWYELEGKTYTVEAPIAIKDSPVYKYRGFMLDTSRNYFPVKDILRTLDAMSWVKSNQFHWHIVDSHSFPLVLPALPELAKAGAYSSKAVFTPKDVKEVVAYAAARGIDVMVEIDTPGHSAALALSHPEHIACHEKTPWATYAAEPPAGQLRLASEATIEFTSKMFSDVADLFPSKFFGSGGDEINARCYAEDEQTQADLKKTGRTLDEAFDYFTQKTHKTLLDKGKTPVVWEELVLNHNVTLAPETAILVWISSANFKAVIQAGFRVIHAASDYFYLDCGHGGWVGDFPVGNSWCDPFKTWQKSYSFNPTLNLTEAESKFVLGGQHLLWTEQSSPANLDSVVWPRAATSAEIFWSGPGDIQTALPRLHDLAFRMIERGVGAHALQPLYCALRPGVCDVNA